ncbi:nucleoside deaminase [Paenibacillus sp. FSL H8-0537]|uniref:nucleoside deaminase n=1 Tax=Paenibacillus sp. FSL H8-0537 TaxID=2921399 RepID=UPI003100AC5D
MVMERYIKGEMNMSQDEFFMREAIKLSKLAVEHGNEPFGAILVKDGEIVFTNENQIYSATDPTFHAEAGLLRRFCEETHITDLHEYTLYSSCEPCYMCSGAMVWTNVGRLVYSASNMELCSILGEQGSPCSQIVFENSHHKPDITAGILREESLSVLAAYFSHNTKG